MPPLTTPSRRPWVYVFIFKRFRLKYQSLRTKVGFYTGKLRAKTRDKGDVDGFAVYIKYARCIDFFLLFIIRTDTDKIKNGNKTRKKKPPFILEPVQRSNKCGYFKLFKRVRSTLVLCRSFFTIIQHSFYGKSSALNI